MNIAFTKSDLTFNLILMSIFIFCYVLFYLFFQSTNFNLANVTIFLISSCIASFSLNSIKKQGINAYNLFFSIFFFFLMLNTYNISKLQIEKDLMDIYYYFAGPLVFGFCLYFAEKINFVNNITFKKIKLINPNKLAVVLLSIYISCWIYIYSITGIRLFSENLLSLDSNMYIVPGFSGFVAILSWLLIMLVPHVNRTLQIAICLSILLLQGILNVKRGDLFRVLLFFLIYYMIKKGEKLANTKIVIRFFLILLGFMIIFSIAGEYRQSLRMGDSAIVYSINDVLQSNIENEVINWLYSYTALNFDVLSVSINQEEPKYSMETLFIPIIRIFGGNTEVENYYSQNNFYGLSGFNATTFLLGYIRDLGIFYVFEIFILGIFVGLVVAFSKKLKFMGIYAYILLLTALTIFGDYYLNPSNFFVIFIAFIVFIFTNIDDYNEHKLLKNSDI